MLLVFLAAAGLSGCVAGQSAWARGGAALPAALDEPTALPTASRTPFQPLHPSPTPTMTATFTATPTASPSATPSPEPTFTPTPEPPTAEPAAELPASALIENISGYPQSYNLDCESRAAVDWAAYFGYSISEQEFLDALPRSDNPDIGFVGSYYGYLGQIPPADYGVHAAPVAALLRAYGVPAHDVKGASWKDLQEEIASGRPVIVWVLKDLTSGQPVEYTALDGSSVTVAQFEHTVILVGYGDDWVSVLDGNLVYSSTLQRFFDSWSVLGNMAILAGNSD